MILPQNPCREGSKTWFLYEALRERGAVTLLDIHRLGNDTARVRCEIKRHLRSNGLDIVCIKTPPDNPLYKVVGPGPEEEGYENHHR